MGSHSEGVLIPAAKDTLNTALQECCVKLAQGRWGRGSELARSGGTVPGLTINPFSLQNPKRVQTCPAGYTGALKFPMTMSGVGWGIQGVAKDQCTEKLEL